MRSSVRASSSVPSPEPHTQACTRPASADPRRRDHRRMRAHDLLGSALPAYRTMPVGPAQRAGHRQHGRARDSCAEPVATPTTPRRVLVRGRRRAAATSRRCRRRPAPGPPGRRAASRPSPMSTSSTCPARVAAGPDHVRRLQAAERDGDVGGHRVAGHVAGVDGDAARHVDGDHRRPLPPRPRRSGQPRRRSPRPSGRRPPLAPMPTMPSSTRSARSGRSRTVTPPARRSAARPAQVHPVGAQQQGTDLGAAAGQRAHRRRACRRRCRRCRPAAAPGRRRPRRPSPQQQRAPPRQAGRGALHERARPAASPSGPSPPPGRPRPAMPAALSPPVGAPVHAGYDISGLRHDHRRGDAAVVRQRQMPPVDAALGGDRRDRTGDGQPRPPVRIGRRSRSRASAARPARRAPWRPPPWPRTGPPATPASADCRTTVRRSPSVNSRSASSGVRSSARAKRSTRTTSMPTATITGTTLTAGRGDYAAACAGRKACGDPAVRPEPACPQPRHLS